MNVLLMINGEECTLDDVQTVEHVVRAMNVAGDGRGVAVALNDTVVPRSRWSETPVAAGDRLEIIHAVQGG